MTKTMLKENEVEKILRNHLKSRGWKLTNLPKSVGVHGCDVTAWHPGWRKVLLVEVKGDGKSRNQTIHNSFYNIIGQIISRMDIQGNKSNKARVYAIAVPSDWEDILKNKISKMKYGWKLLNLKVFLINKNSVKEKSCSYFLK